MYVNDNTAGILTWFDFVSPPSFYLIIACFCLLMYTYLIDLMKVMVTYLDLPRKQNHTLDLHLLKLGFEWEKS